jgi:hypothetical protein
VAVTLDYETVDPVSEEVRATLLTEAEQLIVARIWWSEPLMFFENVPEIYGEYLADDGRLCGGTKIFLSGYSTEDGGYVEVDHEDNVLMAYRDCDFILMQLAQWSQKHGLSWNIFCVGEPIGSIANGKWDAKLEDFVDGMKQDFRIPASLEEAAKAISAKYASRG